MPEAPPEVDLDSTALDELNNREAKSLLDTIDSLRALDVGEIVHLPQIIVVGDQSSGKSSVLEAISHVRFPVKGDVCTRFATELVLRKASASNVDVSIRFADSAGLLGRSSQPFQKSGFGRDDLPRLIEEATERMGVRAGTTKDFSKDVLHVEVTGPDVPSLTLVDLPGFFHSATADQSLEGKNTVDELVRGYMKQNNSIILAVVAANAQLAGQIVLDKCLEHDTGRTRTLGVITKPDLAPAGSDSEKKYLQLAQNKESRHKLALGWHVLRNRGENENHSAESSADERDEAETRFLRSGSWAELAPGNKGIAFLRKKLGKVLLDHIRETLPGVINDIEESLDERVTKLNQLGKARSTIQDMKTYLINIAEEFQRLVRDGVNGIYSDEFFGDLDSTDRKLRANLRNLNNAFDVVLLTKGVNRKILPDDDGSDEQGRDTGSGAGASDIPDYLQPFVSCYDFDDPAEISESDLRQELECWAAANQGKEFPGVPNKDLVIQLFQEQAQPWRAISQRHVDLVTDVTKEFMEHLVTHVVGEDDATISAILKNCIDPFFEERAKVLESKLEELLRPYEEGYGLPLGGTYQDSLSRITLSRLASRVSGMLLEEFPDAEKLTSKKISDAISRAGDLQRGDFGTESIIDMMEAYYKMSRRTFSETVVNLAVESCLVCHVNGILTPTKVNLMEDEDVRQLASESPDVTYERKLLRSQVTKLKDGLKICRYHKPRGAQALPSALSASRVTSKRSTSATRSLGSIRASSGINKDAHPRAKAKAPSETPDKPIASSNASSNGNGNNAHPPASSSAPFESKSLPIFTAPSSGFGTSWLDGHLPKSDTKTAPPANNTGLFGVTQPTVTAAPSIGSASPANNSGLFSKLSVSTTSTAPSIGSGSSGLFAAPKNDTSTPPPATHRSFWAPSSPAHANGSGSLGAKQPPASSTPNGGSGTAGLFGSRK